MTEPKGLHRKLAEVMAEAGRIPKNGTAPQAMGGFPFVQVGDAADVIRKALGERGVSMLPSSVDLIGESEHTTKSGAAMTTMTVRTTWTLVDGETGQTAQIQSIGSGADMGDKASPKAQTNAMKYALLMGFLLSTGDDPELTDSSDRKPKAAKPDKPAGPTLVEQGRKVFVGKVAKGDGQYNDVRYHQTPSGHLIGFRLEIEGGMAVHEVVVTGELGEAMYLTVPEAELLGAEVTVEGMTFRIDDPPKKARARLEVDRIKGPDFEIPAREAPSMPLFADDEQAAIDAALAAV